ncbi:MAG: transglycosylase SLT domain-containing protein [Myxococcota bacterium]
MTTGIGGPRPLTALPQTRDATLSLEQLSPWIDKYGAQYGVRPELIAAVIRQESSFINHAVHRDGTGHGLVGLDDNGLLPDFERWSGLRVGRGRAAATIAPEKQIEFLAKTLADFTRRVGGDEWEAVRAWHAGMGGRDRPHAHDYEDLIRGHEAVVRRAMAPTAGAEAPEEGPQVASSFQPAAREPVRLDAGPGSPVTKSLDYGEG